MLWSFGDVVDVTKSNTKTRLSHSSTRRAVAKPMHNIARCIVLWVLYVIVGCI